MHRSKQISLTLHYTVIQVCFWIHVCLINGFVSYYLTQNGFNTFHIGMVIGIANLLSLFIQPYLASFADNSTKIRVKHIIALNTSCSLIFAMLVHFTSNKSVLFIPFYTGILLTIAMQLPLLNSLSAEHMTLGNNINFSIARGVGSIAFASTSIIFGTVVKKLGTTITMPLYVVSGIIYILAALSFVAPKKIIPDRKTGFVDLINFVKKYKRFVITSFALFLIYTSPSFISNYLYQIVDRVGGSSSELGLALGLSASLELVSMIVYPYVKKKFHGDANLLIIASFMFLVKIICTNMARTLTGLYFAQSLQLLSFGFYIPAQVYYVSYLIPSEDQIKGQMLMNMSGTVSLVFASFIGGYIMNTFGLTVMLSFGSILNLIGLILLLFVIEK